MRAIHCDICNQVVDERDLIEVHWFGMKEQMGWMGGKPYMTGGYLSEWMDLELCSNACLDAAIQKHRSGKE